MRKSVWLGKSYIRNAVELNSVKDLSSLRRQLHNSMKEASKVDTRLYNVTLKV